MNHALAKMLASINIEFVRGIQVLGEMRLLKLGVSGFAHIVFGKLTIDTHGTAQQSAAECAVRERGDSASQGVWENIAFYFAFEEIVGRLNRVQRSDTFETSHLLRREIADTDGTNLPLFIKFTKSDRRFLDGDEGVGPVHLIDIDVVRLETTERILKLLENPLARGVAVDFAVGPVEANFGGEHDLLAVTVLTQGFAHDLFGAPIAVNRRSVDQVDAVVERGMNGADGFLLVSSAPHPAADSPRAEGDSGTNEFCTADVD